MYNTKLNPEKCTFRVALGKLLGYMVTKRRIEANPDQIKDIINMRFLISIKEIQSLTRLTVTLNRLLLRSIDKCK